MTGDSFDLDRFVQAQADSYACALAELRAGRKRSHWVWFVFPQLQGLGRSPMAQHYGLSGLAEARAYAAHPVLGPRLRECVQALLGHAGASAAQLLGDVAAGLVGLAVLLPNLAVTARRLHDIDRSGWWQLIAFVPVIGLILMIYWCAQPTKVESRYD